MVTGANPELTTYDNVLATIFGFSKISEDEAPTKDTHISIEGCYRVFSQLASEFPNAFPDLFFSERNGIPYSQTLEDILFQLGAWRQVQDNNPDFLFFTVTEDKKKLIQGEYSDIYKSDQGTLDNFENFAKRFEVLYKGL